MSSTSSSRRQRHVAPVLRARLRPRLLLAHARRRCCLPRRTRPGSGGPTRAGARRTRARCSRATGNRSSPSSRARTWCRPPHGRERPLGQRLHVHVPLIRQVGLDHHARAVAVRHRVRMRLDRDEHAALFQHGDDALARLEAIEAVEGHARHRASSAAGRPSQESLVAGKLQLRLGAEHVDRAAGSCRRPTSKSLKSCAGRDLHRAGALLRVRIFVRDDRDSPPDERQDGVLADEIARSARRRDAPPPPRRRASSRAAWSQP